MTLTAELADVLWRAVWHARGIPAALLLLGVLLLALSALLMRRDRASDPAWRPSGVKQNFTGYDQAKANAGVHNALARQRERLHRRRS